MADDDQERPRRRYETVRNVFDNGRATGDGESGVVPVESDGSLPVGRAVSPVRPGGLSRFFSGFTKSYSRSMNEALKGPTPGSFSPGISDLLGVRVVRGLPRSGFSIMVLGFSFLGLVLIGRFVHFVGFWTLLLVVWVAIAAVFWKLWHRLHWQRLKVLLPKEGVTLRSGVRDYAGRRWGMGKRPDHTDQL